MSAQPALATADDRPAGPLTIEPVTDAAGMERFLKMPWAVYRGDAEAGDTYDPNWVPPLLLERREHLDPNKNPFFEHAEARFWLAQRAGRDIGRISAQIDRAHLERHGDGAGHFGFLDAVDDREVFAGLLGAAEDWLRAAGMERLRGPFSLSINDESGLLVEGFDSPPSMMMGHAKPYYRAHLEALGYGKAKDLICYDYQIEQQMPETVARFVERAKADPALRLRPFDMARYDGDLRDIIDIFNDAWSDNWGFVPMTEAEIRHFGKSLKPLVRPGFIAIAELRGEPVAMAVSLPNLNEAIADLNGRLLPFGWAKLLWRLKLSTTKSARVALMGVRKRYQSSPFGAALAFAVIDAIRAYHAAHGAKRAELSWILEDNGAMRRMIEMLGGRPYKTYRIYERALT